MPKASSPSPDDQRWMRAALLLARYGLGRTAPNPSVGCVLVREGVLVGRGRTADFGRPHAETEALVSAGDLAQGATAYVTLEPCAHHGQTPPCADALIKAGVKRVVIAAPDPDPRVAGAGAGMLRQAGVEVIEGVLQAKAEEVLAGYLSLRRTGRPTVTVKVASTLDGRIALKDGRSKWITGPRTRAYVHQLRAQHDAVLTASGTVRADDPSLTCRLAGYDGPQPLRVVMSTCFDLNPEAQLATSTDQGAVMLLASEGEAQFQGQEKITERRVTAGADGAPDPIVALETLGGHGVTSVLVEAGGRFVAALLKAGVVDTLIWTRSSGVIGGDGLPSLSTLGLDNLSEGRMFRRAKALIIDDDSIEIFRRR